MRRAERIVGSAHEQELAVSQPAALVSGWLCAVQRSRKASTRPSSFCSSASSQWACRREDRQEAGICGK